LEKGLEKGVLGAYSADHQQEGQNMKRFYDCEWDFLGIELPHTRKKIVYTATNMGVLLMVRL
jgi:hypothetical protein